MNKFDLDLLFFMSENARMKIRDLGHKLKKSSQRLKYTLAVLEKERVLHNSHTIFDYSYFGQVLFKVYFQGGYTSEKNKMEILKQLCDNPYIVSIYELSGEFDLAVEFECPNPSRFNKELKKVAGEHPTLSCYKVVLNLVTHLYPRIYLLKDRSLYDDLASEIIIGGDREQQHFTLEEMKIVHSLLCRPQIRLTRLAKEAGLNVKTAKKILQELQKKRFVKGFKYLLGTDKLSIYKSRLFLKLHYLSKERETHLMDFFLKTSEVVQLHKTVGDWDMEVDLETTDKAKMRQLIVTLREDFKDLIGAFNSIEFYEYYKKSYLPNYLFETGKEN